MSQWAEGEEVCLFYCLLLLSKAQVFQRSYAQPSIRGLCHSGFLGPRSGKDFENRHGIYKFDMCSSWSSYRLTRLLSTHCDVQLVFRDPFISKLQINVSVLQPIRTALLDGIGKDYGHNQGSQDSISLHLLQPLSFVQYMGWLCPWDSIGTTSGHQKPRPSRRDRGLDYSSIPLPEGVAGLSLRSLLEKAHLRRKHF